MATTKPRITVTLTKRQHEVIKAMSDYSGKSMSAFISEMLEAAMPTLERMATTFQKIKIAQDKERSRFIEGLDEAQAALEPIVMNTIGQFDLFMGKVERALDGEGDPACGDESPTSAEAPAPTTNRGATPKRAKSAKPTAATVSGVSLPSKNSKTRRMPTA